MKDKSDEIDTVKPGPPWKNVATFSSYEEANQKRKALEETWEEEKTTHMQIKVKRLERGFVVKTRPNPTSTLSTSNKKRPKKKKQK